MDPVITVPQQTMNRVKVYLKQHPEVKIKRVLDIGAYQGTWTQCVKDSLFPDSYFYMIEGNTDNESYVKKVSRSYEDVGYSIALLSNRYAENVPFYKFTGGKYTTGNTLYMENTDVFQENHTAVNSTLYPLDDVLGESAVDHSPFDLIKLDVQGAEKDVILGGMHTVLNAKLLWIELPITEYNIGSPSFADMILFLSGINFKIVDIIDLHYNEYNTLIQIDALFENAKI